MTKQKNQKQGTTNIGDETIGSRLTQARVNCGFSQSGLARETGIAQTQISAWEADKRRINVDALATLATKFCVSADELLGITPTQDKRTGSPHRRILRRVERIYDLPQSTQSLVLRSLELMIEGGSQRISVRGQPLAKRQKKK